MEIFINGESVSCTRRGETNIALNEKNLKRVALENI